MLMVYTNSVFGSLSSLSLPPAGAKWGAAALLTLACALQGFGFSATAPTGGRASGSGETPATLCLSAPTACQEQ